MVVKSDIKEGDYGNLLTEHTSVYTYDCYVCRRTLGVAAACVAVIGSSGDTDNLLRSMRVV